MSVTVETVETNPNQNTGCSGITNTVSSSSWTLYRVFKESNFAVLEENIIASNEENDATYQIDNFNYHGVFVAKAVVQYVDSNGVSNSSAVQVSHDKRKCSKISNAFLFLFSNKMLIVRAEIHKMLVRIANREDPDQTASSEAMGLPLLVKAFLTGK